MNQQKDKVEYLENQSRRNNIRVDGIPEVHGETWETTESLVTEVLKDKLQMSDEIFIERAHCVEKGVVTGSNFVYVNSPTNYSLPFESLEAEGKYIEKCT